jgi:hypothetical protein
VVTAKIRGFFVAVFLIAAALGVATPASADPGPPCQLALAFLCRLMPAAPNLDHDVDLTQDPYALYSQPVAETPTPETVPTHAPSG